MLPPLSFGHLLLYQHKCSEDGICHPELVSGSPYLRAEMLKQVQHDTSFFRSSEQLCYTKRRTQRL